MRISSTRKLKRRESRTRRIRSRRRSRGRDTGCCWSFDGSEADGGLPGVDRPRSEVGRRRKPNSQSWSRCGWSGKVESDFRRKEILKKKKIAFVSLKVFLTQHFDKCLIIRLLIYFSSVWYSCRVSLFFLLTFHEPSNNYF